MKFLANTSRKKMALYGVASLIFGAVLGILYVAFMAQVSASAFTAVQLAYANTYGVTLVGIYSAIASFSAVKLATSAASGIAFLGALFSLYKIVELGVRYFYRRYIVPFLGKKLLESVEKDASPKIIKRLIKFGANANTQSLNGQTALMCAVEKNNVEIVATLIPYLTVEELNRTKNDLGNTALIVAANKGHASIVKVLLSVHGIRVNEPGHEGYTALILAASCGHTDIVRELIPHLFPQEINAKNNFGNTALILAASSGHIDIVRILIPHLSSQDEVNTKNTFGNTALILAANKGHFSIVEALLSTPYIQVSEKGQNGDNALIFAASCGHADIVRILIPHLSSQDEVNAKNNFGNTALLVAVNNGHTAAVEVLLSARGINVNEPGEEGLTALMLGANRGSELMVKSLLAHRAEVNLVSHNGLTAIKAAFQNKHHDIVDLFKARGAVLNPSDKREWDEAKAYFRKNPHKIKFKKAKTTARGHGGREWGRSFVKINGQIYALNNTKRRLTLSIEGENKILSASENDIGCGGFGRIKFATNQKNEFFAIKVSGPNSAFSPDIGLLLQEKGYVLGQQDTGKKGVIKLGDKYRIEEPKVYTAMPFYGWGQLLEHKNCTSPEVLGLYILMEIQSLHRKGYIHRDIKPDNFMLKKVDGQLTAVPVDFDFLMKIPEGQQKIQMKKGEVLYFTADFDAPEIRTNEEYSFATDIYALGKTLEVLGCTKDIYEGMVRQNPLTRMSIPMAMTKIVQQLQSQPRTSAIDRVLAIYKGFSENPTTQKEDKTIGYLPKAKGIYFSNEFKNMLSVVREEDEMPEEPSQVVTTQHLRR